MVVILLGTLKQPFICAAGRKGRRFRENKFAQHGLGEYGKSES